LWFSGFGRKFNLQILEKKTVTIWFYQKPNGFSRKPIRFFKNRKPIRFFKKHACAAIVFARIEPAGLHDCV
jgi:hypothetical protein